MKHEQIHLSVGERGQLFLEYGPKHEPHSKVNITPLFEFFRAFFAYKFVTEKPPAQSWQEYLHGQVSFLDGDLKKPE